MPTAILFYFGKTMKKPLNFKLLFKYFLTFVGYFFFSLLDGKFSPFSLSLLTANLYVGVKALPSLVLYSIPFLLSQDFQTIIIGVFAGLIICFAFIIYKRYGKKPSFEIVGYLAIALAPYCAFSPSYPIYLKLAFSAIIILSCFILNTGAKIWLIKGLKYKLGLDDLFCSAFLFIVCAYGAIIAFGEDFFFAFSLLTILFTAFLLEKSMPVFSAILLAFPISLYKLNLTFFGIFTVVALIICAVSRYSKLLTAIAVALISFGFFFILPNAFSSSLPLYILTSASCVIYLFFPEKFAEKWKTLLKVHLTDNVGRYSVNVHRNAVAGKLYEMSAVFDEMASSLNKVGSETPDRDKFAQTFADEILISVCSRCKNYNECRKHSFPSETELIKITGFAIAKGKLNLIDLPKQFSFKCICPEEIIKFTNKLVGRYNVAEEEKLALLQGKDLVLRQTKGISLALKDLASSLNKQIEISDKTEEKIIENLLKCGIAVKEVAKFSGEESEIVITLPYKDVFNPLLTKAVSEITGYKSIISENKRISEELSVITVKRSPDMDAVFGIAKKVKDGKKKSGDTHSITKITEGKFLVALNDGMGSGERANEISSSAISLVETFYKAGLKSETVLPMVNKLLSFGDDDNFTALDVAIVDLFSLNVDFIKIGSPYSFILTKDTVKIIEGNSLPLGILDEMRPTVCSSKLSSGDVIILLSDGITDAFASSSDLIDFLSLQRALNPKTLADNILEKALYLNGNVAKDDMTVFCVRIFNR